MVQVTVRDNNVDQALKALKKKAQREGVLKEAKIKRHFISAGEQKREQTAKSKARWNKIIRKEEQRDGGSKKSYWGKKARQRARSPR